MVVFPTESNPNNKIRAGSCRNDSNIHDILENNNPRSELSKHLNKILFLLKIRICLRKNIFSLYDEQF